MTDGDRNQPATPIGPETASKLRESLIAAPIDKFIVACKTLEQASVKAAAQGYNAGAAETMAIVNKEIRIRLRDLLPGDEAKALLGLQESAMEAEGAFLDAGIQETIADLSDEEFAWRRAVNPDYNDADTEERLLTILDEYFYHAMKKGTLQTDWPAKLQEISSFDADLAAQAAAQFFNDAQASVSAVEEFNHIAVAAEQACAAASAKGYFANAAKTMADLIGQIRGNINGLAGEKEMVAALIPIGNVALEKFNTIMEAWATVAFRHRDDPRSAEQIQTAEITLTNFVHSLRAKGINQVKFLPPAPAAS